ncbi:hypothetical protein GG344DRAFT_79367 [Lentinula edodes]|nr:hypothetical protein GG344DRAFT_79367 [Lentinula edodes]
MGPQRTPRRSVAARPSPRRHNMLLRSMVRTQTAPVPTHANDAHPFPGAYRSSSVANTSSGNRSLNRIQRHPSLGPETLFPANPISAPSQNHSHLQGTQNHIHQDSRSTSVVNALPLFANSTGSDPSLNVLIPSGELPPTPTIPAEFMTLVDQRSVEYLDMFHTRSRRLFDEQKATLEFTKNRISLVAQQCIDLQAISHLRKEVKRLEHCCPYCKDLAWEPHMCPVDTPFAQDALATSDSNTLSLAGYFIVQYARSLSVENPTHLYRFDPELKGLPQT